jgi:hypothetical protein
MYSANPFTAIVSAWTTELKAAYEFKQKRFGRDAEEGMKFFSGPYDWFFQSISTDKFFRMPAGEPKIVVTVNKVAELVQLFGPSIYQQNPTRRVAPPEYPNLPQEIFMQMGPEVAQQIPMLYQAQQQQQINDAVIASMHEAILNRTPAEHDLKTHSRAAIDESIIKGLGILWHDMEFNPATGAKMPGSKMDTVDNFMMDHMATSIRNIRWCARRWYLPKWEVERIYRLPPGTLCGASTTDIQPVASMVMRPTTDMPTQDYIEVWEIFSKMGVGGRFKSSYQHAPDAAAAYEHLGDYCHLVIIPGFPYPLNLPPWLFQQQNPWPLAQQAVQWPTPFWADKAWPFTPIHYHEIPGDPWPMSHLTPAMGELKFLNWAYSKIASKIQVTSRDIIICKAEAEDALKRALASAEDLEIVSLETMDGKGAAELVEFMQHPEWNKDIWTVIQAITEQFEQRTGLNELLYGQSTRQMRSAAEADQKFEAVSVRPDDMARQIEGQMSAAARREMLLARWHMTDQDVVPVLGVVGAAAWKLYVEQADVRRVLGMNCTVEADSTKISNQGALVDGLNGAMQLLFTPLMQLAMAGVPGPVNALIGDWAKAHKLRDYQRYLIQLPPMQPAPPEKKAA